MNQIKTVYDIKKLGTILGVWAHPDDETMSSAGIMRTAINNGQKVICITATKGEKGTQDESKWPENNLANIRQQELEKSLKIIGVKKHHWLGFKDGECNKYDARGIEAVSKYIKKYQPNTILTFDQNGFTGHNDHKAVNSWVTEALGLAKCSVTVYYSAISKQHYLAGFKDLDEQLNIFFMLESPIFTRSNKCDINFELSADLMDVKYRALEAMPSQTSVMTKQFSKQLIYNALSKEEFTKAKS